MVKHIQVSLAFTVILLLFAVSTPAAEWDWERPKIALVQAVFNESPAPGIFPPEQTGFPVPPESTFAPESVPGMAPSLLPESGVVWGEPPQYSEVITVTPGALGTSTWQLLPDGLLFHSYLAGEKEPRFASQWMQDRDRGLVWEAVVGGRWGLVRKGGEGPDAEGFQFDVIGAAFVRIDPEEESDLEAADFNAGFIGTWHYGRWRYKLGYNHYSCHLGDEYVLKNLGVQRYNYVRDSILVGTMYDVTPALQVYGEVNAALGTGGGAEPFELQFGAQYSPALPTGARGAPFWAVNGHLREELDFGGNVTAQIGWAWRGGKSNRLFRVGAQHYNGSSMQWSLVGRYENMTGLGMWFDY